MESLMLGTPVIAYDVPGNLVYAKVPAVFRVKEGDYNLMAECVYNVCNLPQSKVDDIIAQSKRMKVPQTSHWLSLRRSREHSNGKPAWHATMSVIPTWTAPLH